MCEKKHGSVRIVVAILSEDRSTGRPGAGRRRARRRRGRVHCQFNGCAVRYRRGRGRDSAIVAATIACQSPNPITRRSASQRLC